MIRIRRIYSATLAAERERTRQVQRIFREAFPDVADYAEKIPDMLDRPFKYGFRTALLVSETGMGRITGFSLILHFPEINSSLLDFIAVAPGIRGGGLGSALYEATREYCRGIGSRALYMEVQPDDPSAVHDEARLGENRRRLRFYELYGVRPIADTAYETPIGSSPAPYLLFDGLGRTEPLGREEARAAVRVILTRKYAHLVSRDYIDKVVASFRDDPVHLRPPRYVKAAARSKEVAPGRLEPAFAVVVAEGHEIHHVSDRGYVERPVRVKALLESVEASGLFAVTKPRRFGERHIRAVHDGDFVTYLRTVCEKLPTRRPVYPYVFPIRRPERRPRELAVRAGYYCIDTFTPLDRNAYRAARRAVDVSMTAAEMVLAGRRIAYALCRPPGHHAGRRTFGGFCYFNNAAVAANRLAAEGKVAVLDIDFHHGNGTQDIFYRRDDVLTVSLHGHPNYAYPYFSGFADEIGEGPGRGFNRNLPLPENASAELYMQTLERAERLIARYKPVFLVVSLGFDVMRGDPTGAFLLSPSVMEGIGRRLASLDLPTLLVQEGGYNLRNLRRGAAALFGGMAEAIAEHRP